MRIIAALCLCVLLYPPAIYAEDQPLALKNATLRELADVGSTALVGIAVLKDTWNSLHAKDPQEALSCQGIRMLVAYGSTAVLKYATHRTRPNGDRTSFSFPSQHTAFATVAALGSGWKWGVQVSLPLAVGMGRAGAAEHYWSDIGVGALDGWLSSKVCKKES